MIHELSLRDLWKRNLNFRFLSNCSSRRPLSQNRVLFPWRFDSLTSLTWAEGQLRVSGASAASLWHLLSFHFAINGFTLTNSGLWLQQHHHLHLQTESAHTHTAVYLWFCTQLDGTEQVEKTCPSKVKVDWCKLQYYLQTGDNFHFTLKSWSDI